MADPIVDPWLALLMAVVGTFGWRVLGTVVAGKFPADSPFFDWVSCVAYALVGGLMLRVILMPAGSLSATPLTDRIGCLVFAILVWWLCGRRVLAGIGAGVAAFAGLAFLRGMM